MRRALLAVALVVASQAASAALALPAEGWASWYVEVPAGTENRCCFAWQRKKEVLRTACELDGRDNGFGSFSDEDRVNGMRVYARFSGGKLEKVRALGPYCPVTSDTPIRELGAVAPAESAAWLASQVPLAGERLAEDALSSLATHGTSPPHLIRAATTDSRPRVRAQAWFWLSQTGAAETESAVNAGLRKETNRHVREQAIFALSQLKGERGGRALVAVASDASLPREDRKQAVFWMSQVESDAAVAYLDKILEGRK